MPHTTIAPSGAVCYRSKTMPLLRAAAYARCLEANATRFCDVTILRSERSKEEVYFVQFRPASDDRKGFLYETEQDKRTQRGEAEGANYLFWKDADRPEVNWCFNPLSGETYEVSPFDCTCPDYQYRCGKAGLRCKHMEAYNAQSALPCAAQSQQASRKPGDYIKQNAHRDFA